MRYASTNEEMATRGINALSIVFNESMRQWWVPRAIQIDYKINWKDRQDDTTTFSALRRRDIMTLHKIFEDIAAIDGASDTPVQDDRS